MKQLVAAICSFLCFTIFALGQNVHIPDSNFLNALIEMGVDENQDGLIQELEAEAVDYIVILYRTKKIVSIEGINSFKNVSRIYIADNDLVSVSIEGLSKLEQLHLLGNQSIIEFQIKDVDRLIGLVIEGGDLTTLDLSGVPHLGSLGCIGHQMDTLDVSMLDSLKALHCPANQLKFLNISTNAQLTQLACDGNQLTSLDLSGCDSLAYLTCSRNELTDLDLQGKHQLYFLHCDENNLVELDFSDCPKIDGFDCSDNNLQRLNIKNGNLNPAVDPSIYFLGNPNLSYICADEFEIFEIENFIYNNGFINCEINTYCSFTNGGVNYPVLFRSVLDSELDGCDSMDSHVPYMTYDLYFNDALIGSFMSNELGEKWLYFQDGEYLVIPKLNSPNSILVNSDSLSFNFPADSMIMEETVCLQPNGDYQDVSVYIVPQGRLRPGFEINLLIKYVNYGNLPISGTIELLFDDDVMELVQVDPDVISQMTGALEWEYLNLLSNEVRYINATMLLNSPMDTPPLIGDEELQFKAEIFPNDDNQDNNIFTLNQTVVNSYDPNDKTCLQGSELHPDKLDEAIHYMIRFENTGTAEAINVVVKDVIDTARFDISSIQPIDGSHDFFTRVHNANVVEFIFENIYLPFDDANNDGYVTFKINPKSGLGIGDTLINEAEIYFDFNFPIITDPAVTEITELSSTKVALNDSEISVFPNPVKDQINLQSPDEIYSIDLMSLNGQTILQRKYPAGQTNVTLTIGDMVGGTYLLKVQTDKGAYYKKVVVQ